MSGVFAKSAHISPRLDRRYTVSFHVVRISLLQNLKVNRIVETSSEKDGVFMDNSLIYSKAMSSLIAIFLNAEDLSTLVDVAVKCQRLVATVRKPCGIWKKQHQTLRTFNAPGQMEHLKAAIFNAAFVSSERQECRTYTWDPFINTIDCSVT